MRLRNVLLETSRLAEKPSLGFGSENEDTKEMQAGGWFVFLLLFFLFCFF